MDSSTTSQSRRHGTAVPWIVGVGASAGGLEALEAFLRQVPPDSGMAYILVQHLDPTKKGLLPELLRRVTTMPVREVVQNMRVEPDHVYVIPTNTELTLAEGRLRLSAPTEPHGMRLPINVLFSSLASELGERAIGVVLSGMGSDGTLGLQAIKTVGGLTAVEEPSVAQFDAMPNSAIHAGCADIIAPPGELPGRILAFVDQVPAPGSAEEQEMVAAAAAPLDRIIQLLRGRTGHDFSCYKPSTLHRRIERRMGIHGIGLLPEYAGFLEHNEQEIDLLFNELLIGVTSFFRDRAVWKYLADEALPELLKRHKTEHNLRAWVVGCSTGEEAYSLAMVFCEVVERLGLADRFTLQIFASDLNPEAIASARRGVFPPAIKSDVSKARLARFFTKHETYYRIKQSIRDMVMFAQHDVVLDPPFTRLDLIACRNLLIYFDAMLQRRLLPLFHYSLAPGGMLMLGSSETVGRFTNLFTALKPKLRIYRREDDISIRAPEFLLNSFPPLSGSTNKEPPVSSTDEPSNASGNLQSAVDQVLLQVYAPAAVLLNRHGDIIYISGRTGNYLEPPAGKANWNIHAMARDGLRAQLSEALQNSVGNREPVQLHAVHVQGPVGTLVVDVTVQALFEPPALKGMTLVVFRDVVESLAAEGGKGKSAGGSRAAEIQHYQDEINALREEARASREELQSSNEELQSTNEELQSTNEELTTSKEEMQSMNEELQTINSELQTKLDDLALAQSDMQNILNGVDIAILFLDQDLNVRRFTKRAEQLFSLRESDVGRPLSDLNTVLQYPQLQEDALETLSTLAATQKQVESDDGRWFSVRIIPYRRVDNVIDGVVVTLVDITDTKKLELALRDEAGD